MCPTSFLRREKGLRFGPAWYTLDQLRPVGFSELLPMGYSAHTSNSVRDLPVSKIIIGMF